MSADAIEFSWLLCWASDTGAHGMPTPETLEAEGWVRVRRHPWWSDSWLMRREVA